MTYRSAELRRCDLSGRLSLSRAARPSSPPSRSLLFLSPPSEPMPESRRLSSRSPADERPRQPRGTAGQASAGQPGVYVTRGGDRELISSDREAPPARPPHALTPRGARHVFINSPSPGTPCGSRARPRLSGHAPGHTTADRHRRGWRASVAELGRGDAFDSVAERPLSQPTIKPRDLRTRPLPARRCAPPAPHDPRCSSGIRPKEQLRGRRGGIRTAAPTPVSANTTLGQGVDNSPPPPASLIRPGVTPHKHCAVAIGPQPRPQPLPQAVG